MRKTMLATAAALTLLGSGTVFAQATQPMPPASDPAAPAAPAAPASPQATPEVMPSPGATVQGNAATEGIGVAQMSAEELGGRSGTEPLPVGLVVLATHRPGASWCPEVLTPGQAVIEMIAHTVPARLRPAATLAALERAVSRATVVRGERGEARDLAPRLLSLVEGPLAATRTGSPGQPFKGRTR